VLFAQLLAEKEVNSAAHHAETLACPCNSGRNHSVSERLVNWRKSISTRKIDRL